MVEPEERSSERVSEQVLERVLERAWERASEQASEQVSERVLKQASERVIKASILGVAEVLEEDGNDALRLPYPGIGSFSTVNS